MHPDGPTHLFLLPVELCHQIVFFLDVGDVFALRRTCKRFFALTQDRSLWMVMFTRLRMTQALPCSRNEFIALSDPQAERALLAASKVGTSFLRLREHPLHHIPAVEHPYSPMSTSACSWRVLDFISDRFILSVDTTAIVIWDTTTPASLSLPPWAHFTLSNFLGYVDCYSMLYIAICRVHVDHASAVIYSVPLPLLKENEHPQGQLHREAEFLLLDNAVLKHMDPQTGRALFYLPPISIHIVRWSDSNRRTTILLQPDELDQAWNGVTSLRFCGPYILCFRIRAVEAYPIPTDTPTTNPLPLLRHRFGPVSFRAVSLSHVRVSSCPSSGDVYTIYMLTNDLYQGMFHYRIRVTTSPVPAMSVRVLARGSITPSEPLPFIPGTETRYALEDIIRRQFVSTWSLGSAGLRGVWVERQRGNIDRRVVAFTTHPSRLRRKAQGDEAEDQDVSDEPSPMEGNVVHVISSYDLRDDVTMCAVSEWTGRIALGSRIGAISLL